MQFSTLSELFYMAGHGPYVWAAYAMFFAVVLSLIVLPQRAHARELRMIAEKRRLKQRTDLES